MGILVKNQAAIPNGTHKGLITEARETTRVFDPLVGPEQTVELVIQPGWRKDDKTETMPVTVNFSPILNGLSGLSGLLDRLKVPVTDGESFEPSTLAGREITFTATRNAKGFVRVHKDTIRAA